jgi:hypothetical protein
MPKDVQFVTNAGHLAATMRKRADTLQNRFRTTAKRYALTLKATAEELSSGPLGTHNLRAMGNPYKRALLAGAAGQPDYIVNIQSGNFRGSWVTRVQKVGDTWTITLLNTSPESRYMMGTKRARMRPILEEVMRRHGHLLTAEVHAVVVDVINKDATGTFVPMTTEGDAAGGSMFGAISYAVTVGVGSVASALDSGIAGI